MVAEGRVVSAVATRMRGRLRGRDDRYAICPEDGFWYRPVYTDGKCPLCGEPAPGDAPSLPLSLRLDRFGLGLAALILVSAGMSALVLYMYLSA